MSATMCWNCEYINHKDSRFYPGNSVQPDITLYKCTFMERNAAPMWVVELIEDQDRVQGYVEDQDGQDCAAWDFIQDPDR